MTASRSADRRDQSRENQVTPAAHNIMATRPDLPMSALA